MIPKDPSFQIFTETEIRKHLSQNEFFLLTPPFFLLVNTGQMNIDNGEERNINALSISVFAKEEKIHAVSLSEDCTCILLQYKREYLRSMTLKLALLDAFKYVYSSPQLTFDLLTAAFKDLWFLAKYIARQTEISKNSDLEKHLLRHLNYSFLYSSIDKMNTSKSFEVSPRNQQEKLVLEFLKNLKDRPATNLKVSDYAELQHVTTRHLSTTIKQLTGMSALEIIHRMVFHTAKNELTETDKPISEIAYFLGYTDPYTFSHFFKKKSGLSPTEFRAKFQG